MLDSAPATANPAAAIVIHSYAGNILHRIYTALATLPVYLSLILAPHHLHMERVFPVFTSIQSWQVLTGAIITVIAAAQIVLGKARRGLALSWGLLWFGIAWSPATGILVPIDAFISEHWMYLPTIGLFLGVCEEIAHWLTQFELKKANIAVAVCVTIAALALGIKTYKQNEIWRNPVTFYKNILNCGGRPIKAHNNLALYYWRHREFEKAIKNLQMAISVPGVDPPSKLVRAHLSLALMYLNISPDAHDSFNISRLGDILPTAQHIPEAISELKAALKINPHYYWANKLLATIYAWQGDKEKALLYNEQAIPIDR